MGDCTCSSRNAKVAPTGPRRESLPQMVPIAVLPAGDPLPLRAAMPGATAALGAGFFRPPTSLLRLHCALTI